jgi:hypothetical protein
VSRYPYQRAQAHAHWAFASLRVRDAEAADAQVRAAETALRETLAPAPADEHGDLELAAWLVSMDAETALLMRDGQDAGDRIAAAIGRHELAPIGPRLLRQFGDAVERTGLVTDVLSSELGSALDLQRSHADTLRFSDTLVARWQRLAPPAREASPPEVRSARLAGAA